ncbi:MAG: aspartate--tRNA ligase [Candidatus Omnitrophica bacterium]|nr:aspartate--tRNA ligase [Candidatus Omnitrophota bacterium]
MEKRTHTCGGLRPGQVGEKVTLLGWVAARRDHGKLIFIDIRDREGITQVVFVPSVSPDAHKVAETLRSEWCVQVKGEVVKRPKKTENPDIPTGLVEVCAEDLLVLSESETVPFEVEDAETANEDVRLAYRYLDLRRPSMYRRLKMRHDVIAVIRKVLDEAQFLEVETPILTRSTPEGARDYLVPSRLNEGQFYALPQSPQLFKQLLMVGGVEKYFQIARCFRDEDLRSDRQPEFTQLDLEMSFVTEEDIFALMENLFYQIFKQVLDVELTLPFPRIPHSEAMARYGTDKPDLRKGEAGREFAFCWVTEFPLFGKDEESGRLMAEHHPFTSPFEEDIPKMETHPLEVRSRAYDLVLNGVEVGSGSIRIHRRDLQEKVFAAIGINGEEAQRRFGFLLNAFRYGPPPHGGIAPGIDRLVAIMAGVDSIREVIAFPKTQKAACPLTNAPSTVDDKQLRDLGITVNQLSPSQEGG